jgi:hypothetical protein
MFCVCVCVCVCASVRFDDSWHCVSSWSWSLSPLTCCGLRARFCAPPIRMSVCVRGEYCRVWCIWISELLALQSILARNDESQCIREWQEELRNMVLMRWFWCITLMLGYAVAQLVEALRYQAEDRGFDSRWCHWQPFWLHCGPWIDSTSNRNVRGIFWRG